jgi:dimethylhistidine N-methyltransferase
MMEIRPAAGSGAPPLLGGASATGVDPAFRGDVLSGLRRPRKELPWLHTLDARGVELAGGVGATLAADSAHLELSLLRACVASIAELVGDGASLIELGGCDPDKARVLLGALRNPLVYMPIDVAARHLWSSAMQLQLDYPFLAVRPVNADFAALRELPEGGPWEHDRVTFLLFGAVLGRYDPFSAARLLRLLAALTPRNLAIVGLDLRKREDAMLAPYADVAGCAAELNLNLLSRINRELGGDFDMAAFEHLALWNETVGRVEVHLKARSRQIVRIAGETFAFEPGELIHTQSAYKYTLNQLHRLALHAGYVPVKAWTDPGRRYGLHILAKAGAGGGGAHL